MSRDDPLDGFPDLLVDGTPAFELIRQRSDVHWALIRTRECLWAMHPHPRDYELPSAYMAAQVMHRARIELVSDLLRSIDREGRGITRLWRVTDDDD
jgi:hypothetical protein